MGAEIRGGRGDMGPADWEHCLLLIPAPSDRKVHECLRAIAWRWASSVRHEQLWIEGDVPMRAGLSSARVPGPLQKLIDSDCAIISKIELEIAGLALTYSRSGGHSPFRESFFDELRLEISDDMECNEDVTREVLRELCTRLHVSSHSSTSYFKHVIEQIGLDQLPHLEGGSGTRGFGETQSS